MRDDNTKHARQSARQGDNMANPHRPGSRDWFAWEDAYRDQRKVDNKDCRDGAPPGCPAWG